MNAIEKLEWSNSLTLYNPTIDAQHKMIFDYINEIIELERIYPKSEQFAVILSKISDYGLMHFKTEEKLMSLYGYPKFKEHKADHLRYTYEVALFNTNFKDVNHTDPKVVLRFIKNWWHEHIMGRDMEFGVFVKENIVG